MTSYDLDRESREIVNKIIDAARKKEPEPSEDYRDFDPEIYADKVKALVFGYALDKTIEVSKTPRLAFDLALTKRDNL